LTPAPDAGDTTPDLRGLDREALGALLRELGEPPYRLAQTWRWLHYLGAASWADMTSLPRGLRARLAERCRLTTLEIAERQVAEDGTRKYRLRTPGGDDVETVLIPDGDRLTICVSSQVGCAMGCAFCLTARMGFVRNLTTGEIVDQVNRARADLAAAGIDRRVTNLVMMGMGEPLHNYDAVVRAVALLTDPEGYAFSHRKVTVSTVGLAPRIGRFGHDARCNLAVSLTGTTDEQRSAVMPINQRYGLRELLEACAAYPLEARKRITFEYVLLGGFNDAVDDADRLVSLLAPLRSKVNLLPFNAWPGAPFPRPDDATVEAFRARLEARGLCATVRVSRGRDILAACGQLATAARRARRDTPAHSPALAGSPGV
jgi:23S rRNA (adenine2503-C2)-methyltransferase